MPNVDGLQSTRLIREMGYSAPIVALTAFAEESNVKECLDSGMDFFLPKPIRRPALKQVLKRYCATIPEGEEGEVSPASSAGKTSAKAMEAKERKERKNTTAGKGGPLTSTYANGSVSEPSLGKEGGGSRRVVNGVEKVEPPLLERRDADTSISSTAATVAKEELPKPLDPEVNGLAKSEHPKDDDSISPYS